MNAPTNKSASATVAAVFAVFFGGASYGFMAPLAKVALAAGATWQQIVAGQEVLGCLLFGIAFLLVLAKTRLHPPQPAVTNAPADNTAVTPEATTAGAPTPTSATTPAHNAPGQKRPAAGAVVHLAPAQVLKLMAVGACTCGTCIFYNISLSLLPVAGAITMLFQFTWIGVVIQVIATRRAPHSYEVLAALIVVAGTLFASGFIGLGGASLDPLGVACGLVSAVFCATFMHLTSCVETQVPLVQRGFIIGLGAAAAATAVCPSFIPAGVATGPLLPCWIALGVFALFLPVFLFGAGTNKLPTGVSTVLASAELPCSILLTFFFIGESIDLLQIVGVVLILAGVVVSQWGTLRANN